MVVVHDIPGNVSVDVTIAETGSRYRGMDSPTTTLAEHSTPEETPVVRFTASFTLAKEENTYYDDIPGGDHIREVTLKNGPEGRYDIGAYSFSTHD